MKFFGRISFAFLMGWVITSYNSQGQTSQNVTFLGNFNGYPAIGYNDCWGYTAPDGREYALLGVLNGTSVVDITDAPTFTEIGFVPSNTSTWKDIKTYRNYAYVVTEANSGLQVIDLSYVPDSVHLVTTYTGFSSSHNINIDTANAMLYAEGSGAQPVIAISLADPINPVQVSFFGISCHDVYARDNIVYTSDGSFGSIGVYDLSTPSSPVLVKRFNVPNPGYVHNAWPSDDNRYLMTTEETTGKTVKLWDISDINNPVITDDYLASPGIAHNTHVKGNFAYISHYVDGLRIVDISNPDSIFEAGYYDTFPGPGGSFSGCWGAFPFFGSGKVIASDRSTGLYVVYFAGSVTGVKVPGTTPEKFVLNQNYPNPFNPTTTIRFAIPEAGKVHLDVFDVLGRLVRRLVDDEFSAGEYSVQWNGANDLAERVVSGTYFYRLAALGSSSTRKMILMQ